MNQKSLIVCSFLAILIIINGILVSPARADWNEDDWEDLARRTGRRVVREVREEIDEDELRDAREEVEEDIDDWERVVESDWNDWDDAEQAYHQVRRSAHRVKRIVDIID